jgi:membrane-associated phospholipid phosphatase
MTLRFVPRLAMCVACLAALGLPSQSAAQVLSQVPPADAWLPVATAGKPAPFSSLFTDTVRDLRQVPSGDTLKLLSIGALAAAVGHTVDRSTSRGLSSSSTADSVLSLGETLGGARVQLAAAVATYAVGKLTNARTATLGADLIRAQILAQTMTVSIKTAVGRTRPDGTQYSFPSGHSSTTFATATVVQRHFGWKAGIPAYALASYVAASRIQDRRHFLSDVTFGAALGIVAGRTVTIGRGDHRFAVAPTVVPGGGGVSLTWAD